MAGKADLVNGIVDRDATALRRLPVYDGWGDTTASPGEFPWQLSSGAADGEWPWQLSGGAGG